MRRSLRSRLDKHLAGVSALAAAAAIGGGVQRAEAVIVYHAAANVNIPSTYLGVYLNVVTGANGTSGSAVAGWDVSPYGTEYYDYLDYYNPGAPAGGVYVQDGTGFTANLPLGTLIGPASLYGSGEATLGGPMPHILGSSNNLVGFRFQNEAAGNQVQYGWMRIAVSASGLGFQPRTIIEYAYEDSGAAIAAGDVGTATGACCKSDGTCQEGLNSGQCTAAGGTSFVVNTACAQAGCPQPVPCCKPDGTCSVLLPTACVQSGGVSVVAPTCAAANCPQPGACCLSDGTCSVLAATTCRTQAGIFKGGACASANCPTAYVYSGAPVTVPDGLDGTGTNCGAAAIAAVTVADSFTVASADASWFMTHSYQGDVRFSLRHVETGTTVMMMNRPGFPQSTYGFGNDNFGDAATPRPIRVSDNGTQLYDAAPAGAQLGTDNVSGTWSPESALAAFVGENSAGTWQLLVEDCWGAGDTGTLNGFVLNLGRPSAPACYANCDSSTQPPVLNVADFTCFLQKYAAGDPYANCDASTQPPVLNVADFTCFLQKYAAGCT